MSHLSHLSQSWQWIRLQTSEGYHVATVPSCHRAKQDHTCEHCHARYANGSAVASAENSMSFVQIAQVECISVIGKRKAMSLNKRLASSLVLPVAITYSIRGIWPPPDRPLLQMYLLGPRWFLSWVAIAVFDHLIWWFISNTFKIQLCTQVCRLFAVSLALYHQKSYNSTSLGSKG